MEFFVWWKEFDEFTLKFMESECSFHVFFVVIFWKWFQFLFNSRETSFSTIFYSSTKYYWNNLIVQLFLLELSKKKKKKNKKLAGINEYQRMGCLGSPLPPPLNTLWLLDLDEIWMRWVNKCICMRTRSLKMREREDEDEDEGFFLR